MKWWGNNTRLQFTHNASRFLWYSGHRTYKIQYILKGAGINKEPFRFAILFFPRVICFVFGLLQKCLIDFFPFWYEGEITMHKNKNHYFHFNLIYFRLSTEIDNRVTHTMYNVVQIVHLSKLNRIPLQLKLLLETTTKTHSHKIEMKTTIKQMQA